ncbi:MAG: alpha-galactosidase [Planctomycetota bacterium]|nr:MAG: alpha-galactosidase [Planctomycetota bacterium]
MKRRTFTMLALAACIAVPTFASFAAANDSGDVYDARIGEKEILTPPPPKAPRINGPKVYGARPGRIFLYRIPTQGVRPMRFAVENLPDGLKLDAENGILTGTVPSQRGEYPMTFVAENAYGKAQRPFKLVVGDTIALTPPTGWNSWGGHMVDVSDAIMRKAADIFVERGLADVGFQYVGIDDCWMRLNQEMYDTRTPGQIKKHAAYDYESTGTIGPIRDEYGRILPNGKFPDMKAMCDYIHSKGLKAGIYCTPGPRTCQGWAGSYGHERADADRFAEWGFDLLKYDQCSGGKVLAQLRARIPGYQVKDFWKPMSDYLRVQDRDILFNLCQYGQDDPWTWAPSIGIQSWRIGGDLNHHVENYFINALRIAGPLREYSKPGQWNDPDFMYIHRIKNVGRMAEPSEEIPLDTNQRYQYVTLWSIIAAPFFFSCDIENIDDFTIGLLTNADVVNINQDELGHVAEIVRNDDKTETVMLKKLADGSKVLAVFNRDAQQERTITVSWGEIGECCELEVFDVWRQKPLGTYKGGISVLLSPNGVALFRLTN